MKHTTLLFLVELTFPGDIFDQSTIFVSWIFSCLWFSVGGLHSSSCVDSITPRPSTTNVGQMNQQTLEYAVETTPRGIFLISLQLLTAGLFFLLLVLCRWSSYGWCVNADENLGERDACWEGIRQSGRYLRRYMIDSWGLNNNQGLWCFIWGGVDVGLISWWYCQFVLEVCCEPHRTFY